MDPESAERPGALMPARDQDKPPDPVNEAPRVLIVAPPGGGGSDVARLLNEAPSPAGRGRSDRGFTGSVRAEVVASIDEAVTPLRAERNPPVPVVVLLGPDADPAARSGEAPGKILAADAEVCIVLCGGCAAPDQSALAPVDADRVLMLSGSAGPEEVAQAVRFLTGRWRRARAVAAEADSLRQQASDAASELERQIRRRSEVEKELRHLAYHDQVTGLPNRVYLFDRIEQCIQRAARVGGYRYAVLYLDLDNFKLINDTMGHDRGDRLLQDVAERLRACMRSLDTIAHVEEDVAARVGGDEFIVLLEGLRDTSDSVRVAERFLEALSRPFEIGNRELIVCASIGVATSDLGYESAQDVLRDADTAMYRAKSSGKGRCALFDPEMHAAAHRRLDIESRLREAILGERMELWYQPIVDVRTQELIGFEALFRCELPGLETDAQEMIIVAEETGLIIPIGRWVFRRACRDLERWRRDFPSAERLRVNINTSRRELADEALVESARAAMAEHHIPPDRIGVEVTESGIIHDAELALQQLVRMRDLGVELHMDDFGTGYSSLACLHAYPLDGVKIDRAFTATMTHDPRYIAVVKAIVSLCQTLRMRVTVEGIETPEQLELVDSLGCDSAQGYMFARPMSAAQVAELLARVADGGPIRLAA
jgi:diguanylate cyclase (GGDEF)-like protein